MTSSYVAANTQTSRVIYAGARGGLWPRTLAQVSPRFRTPAVAAVAFVAPSIVIGIVSTAFTDPGTASGFLSPYSVLPWLTLALIAVGIAYQYVLGRFRPDALASAPALLEGASDDTPDAGVP